MAIANTLSALSASLKIGYTDEFMEAHTNFNAPALAKFQTLKSKVQAGKSFDWVFPISTPQNITTPADGAALPTPKARVDVAGSVVVASFVGTFDITFLAEAVAKAEGAFNGGEVKRSVKECVTDVTKHQNRIYVGTHGTGRLAQVNAATSASASFVGKLPIGTLLLRKNMVVSAYTADTSGSVRDSLDGITISKIVASTRTVTLASGTYTLVANDHVYLTGSYGNAPNGIRGLVDDGTNLTTIHGASRSTYDELKSLVLANSGTLRDLTEDLLVDLAHGVRQRSGQNIDLLLMNFGQLAKFYKFVRADRRFNVSGAEVPTYNVGYKKLPTFFVGGQEVEVLPSEDVFPREVYGLTTSQIRRIVAQKLDWKTWGSDSNIFQQALVSGAYALGAQATLYAAENIATYMPAAHGVVQDLFDNELCGTAVGGTDS